MDAKLLRMLLDLVVLAEGDAIRLGDRAFSDAARIAVDGVRAAECGGFAAGKEHLVRATEAYMAVSHARVARERIEAEIDAELSRGAALVRQVA